MKRTHAVRAGTVAVFQSNGITRVWNWFKGRACFASMLLAFSLSAGVDSAQAASITTLAPLPPVSFIISAWVSVFFALMAASAPYCRAKSSLFSCISEMKQLAPESFTRFKILKPSGPAPILKTVSLPVMPAREKTCSAMVKGSIITASSQLQLAGIG